MLCSTCSAIFELSTVDIGTYEYSPTFVHHETLEQWRTASDQGCNLCYQLLSRIERETNLALIKPGSKISLAYTVHTRPELGRARPDFNIFFNFSAYKEPGQPNFNTFRNGLMVGFQVNVYLYLIHQSSDVLRPQLDWNLGPNQMPDAGDRTSSDQTFGLINHWIDQCQTKHTVCKHLNNGGIGWYPTRLLNVDTGREDVIRLQISSQVLPSGPYVTLSHCWGHEPLITLTPDNIQSMKDGIPIESLPSTFRDAVVITRRLGVKYIWIDSLCILQGPGPLARKDWEFEARSMCQVYALSYLNIAATHARDSRDGCFVQRKPIYISHEVVYVDWGQVHSEYHQNPPKVPYQLSYEPSLWDLEVTKAPLNHRGWVVQERLLAPRVVHFSSRQVFWECMELEASECFPRGDPCDESLPLKQTCKMDMLDASSWALVVRRFTESQLTKEEDRLIAIAGIAQRFGEALSDVYVAGLWKSRLPTDLLWDVFPGDPTSSRPERYRAPSWSWASLEASICIADKRTMISQLIEVLGLEIITCDGSPYGLIVSGSISLKGPLVKAIPTFLRFRSEMGKATGDFDILDAPPEENSAIHNNPFEDNSVICYCQFDEVKRMEYKEMYWLLCGIYEGFNKNRPELWCLMLLPVKDRQGIFTRIGTVEVKYVNKDFDRLKEYINQIQIVTIL